MSSQNKPLIVADATVPQLTLPEKYYGAKVLKTSDALSARLSILTFLLVLVSGASKLWFPDAFLILLGITLVLFVFIILYRLFRSNLNILRNKSARLLYADEIFTKWVEDKYDVDIDQTRALILLNGQISTVDRIGMPVSVSVALKIAPEDFFLEEIFDEDEFYANEKNNRFSFDDVTSGGEGYFDNPKISEAEDK